MMFVGNRPVTLSVCARWFERGKDDKFHRTDAWCCVLCWKCSLLDACFLHRHAAFAYARTHTHTFSVEPKWNSPLVRYTVVVHVCLWQCCCSGHVVTRCVKMLLAGWNVQNRTLMAYWFQNVASNVWACMEHDVQRISWLYSNHTSYYAYVVRLLSSIPQMLTMLNMVDVRTLRRCMNHIIVHALQRFLWILSIHSIGILAYFQWLMTLCKKNETNQK